MAGLRYPALGFSTSALVERLHVTGIAGPAGGELVGTEVFQRYDRNLKPLNLHHHAAWVTVGEIDARDLRQHFQTIRGDTHPEDRLFPDEQRRTNCIAGEAELHKDLDETIQVVRCDRHPEVD